jgi:hypothetical protein
MAVADIGREEYDRLLADHLLPYMPHLNRKEVRKNFITTVRGYLSDLKIKTGPAISRAFFWDREGPVAQQVFIWFTL